MTDICPFCGRDPFHRVDNGVGMEAVAVTCCELGDEFFRGMRPTPEEVTMSWEDFQGLGNKLAEYRHKAEAHDDAVAQGQPVNDLTGRLLRRSRSYKGSELDESTSGTGDLLQEAHDCIMRTQEQADYWRQIAREDRLRVVDLEKQIAAMPAVPAETTASSADPLLPCPFCSMPMTLQGDYTEETAWNFYCHADRDAPEVSMCPMKDHQINTMRDMWTPDHNEATAWNTRAALRSPAASGDYGSYASYNWPGYLREMIDRTKLDAFDRGTLHQIANALEHLAGRSQPVCAENGELADTIDAVIKNFGVTCDASDIARGLQAHFNVTRKNLSETRG
jgi:hypothetical protein